LVVEAMAALGFMGQMSRIKYSLQGKPMILRSVDGGALSVIPSMEASSRSFFVAVDLVS
jgi:hypothetical protein